MKDMVMMTAQHTAVTYLHILLQLHMLYNDSGMMIVGV